MDDKKVFRVTKTLINPAKFSWLNKPRVRYGGLQMAVQTYVYSFYDSPRKYDVKVELCELNVIGEINMTDYMARRKIETFVR